MPKMNVRVLRDLSEGVEVGSKPCACGGCRPTASIFRDDPRYERHDPALAQGPCCCDRFFVVGPEADARARAMAAERHGVDSYVFDRKEVQLPWGGTFPLVVADFRP